MNSYLGCFSDHHRVLFYFIYSPTPSFVSILYLF